MSTDAKNVYFVKKPFLSGISKPLQFRITDDDGVGFKPDAITMSIYDSTLLRAATSPYGIGTVFGPAEYVRISDTFVNNRNDVDVLDSCDADGNVSFTLDPEDTTRTSPIGQYPSQVFRHVLFRVTFGSPSQTEKLLYILTIAPDRETVAV